MGLRVKTHGCWGNLSERLVFSAKSSGEIEHHECREGGVIFVTCYDG